MSDTGGVAAGTHTAVHKISPRFCPYLGLWADPECIRDLASLMAWHAGVWRGVGLFTHAGLNTQDFIKSITRRWYSLYVIHMHVHPLPLCNSRGLLILACVEMDAEMHMEVSTHMLYEHEHTVCRHVTHLSTNVLICMGLDMKNIVKDRCVRCALFLLPIKKKCPMSNSNTMLDV